MSTTCLSALLNEPLNWMLTPHGDGYALGWEGSPDLIDRAYNLFTNCYTPSKRGMTPQLVRVHERLSYIWMPTIESIQGALTTFFSVHAIRDGRVPVRAGWEGEDPEYVYEPDEVEAARLGAEDAQAFMAHIQHTDFLPPMLQPNGDSYYMGWLPPEELVTIEDYASWASA